MRFRSQARFVAFQFDGIREASGHCSPVFWEWVNPSDRDDPEKTPDNSPIKWSTVCGRVSRWVLVGDWIVEPFVSDSMPESLALATAGRRVLSDAEFRKEFQACDDPISRPLAIVLSEAQGLVSAVRREDAGEQLLASEAPHTYAHRLRVALVNLHAAAAPLKLFAEAGEQSAEDRDNAAADPQAHGKNVEPAAPPDVVQ